MVKKKLMILYYSTTLLQLKFCITDDFTRKTISKVLYANKAFPRNKQNLEKKKIEINLIGFGLPFVDKKKVSGLGEFEWL